MKLHGLIHFSSPVLCSQDTLGKSFDIVIGGVNGVIKLPILSGWNTTCEGRQPRITPLMAPAPANKWTLGEDDRFFWGELVGFSSGRSSVRRALLEFRVRNQDPREIVQEVHKEINQWMRLFESYIKLLTKQKTRCNVLDRRSSHRLKMYMDSPDGFRRITAIDEGAIHVTVPDASEDISLDPEQAAQAFKWSSLKQQPKLEYQLLLEAYAALVGHDSRKAILMAASALEVALTNGINTLCSARGIDFTSDLLKKYKTLGGRLDLYFLLGAKLPGAKLPGTKDYYQKTIVKPRNEVVHDGESPDYDKACKSVGEVEKLLCLLSPGPCDTACKEDN
jgi:hypothetical protein